MQVGALQWTTVLFYPLSSSTHQPYDLTVGRAGSVAAMDKNLDFWP
jgi:hypothetical protein